ncbi:type II restriction endonuclease [Lysobacter sp.]|uniref:type II restriction endonuclease n=1 Tax=Lysobacter sp. TaxID=72226 RepID=UPI002D378668|nr:type II restriction endonuclease [Lysobacter sp.]HZX78922.1 type II restriction endonuclease [Lysobacter sp.]
MIEHFHRWLEAHEGSDWHWYVKRLSANDTLATESHQAGPYLPNEQAFLLFPSLRASQDPNPKVSLSGSVDSHDLPDRELTVTWYRAAKNECRITRWGGRSSPVLDPDSTGSVTVFAFRKPTDADADHVSAWVCSVPEEELLIERVGVVDPGRPLLVSILAREAISAIGPGSCSLTPGTIPAGWLHQFPTGEEIVRKCVELRPCHHQSADERLIARRNCEFEMFRSIESLHVLPRVQLGFQSIDEFIEYSHTINNRRKSRSGRSLELHVKGILTEESVKFSHGEISERNKRPDFLFPSSEDYRHHRKPLWMLAAKTTCKDRWRQILNEADLIPRKHLLTLQEGVSLNQFQEMRDAGVTLVVPAELHGKYPKAVRPELMTFSAFISLVKHYP